VRVCFLSHTPACETDQRERCKADRRFSKTLRGSLEVFDLAHPAGQWVPSGKIWATIFKSLILNG
jgi:hypothetical protein